MMRRVHPVRVFHNSPSVDFRVMRFRVMRLLTTLTSNTGGVILFPPESVFSRVVLHPEVNWLLYFKSKYWV